MRTWKRIQGMQVVSRAEGAFVGKLDDFLFELSSHRISGWRLRSGGVFARIGGVAAADLELLGRDVAIVRAEAAIEGSGSGRPKPVEGRAWVSAWLGTPALTRGGAALGGVRDVVIDDSGDAVHGVILDKGLFLPLRGHVQLGPSAVIVEGEAWAVRLPEDEGSEGWWAAMVEALQAPPQPRQEGA